MSQPQLHRKLKALTGLSPGTDNLYQNNIHWAPIQAFNPDKTIQLGYERALDNRQSLERLYRLVHLQIGASTLVLDRIKVEAGGMITWFRKIENEKEWMLRPVIKLGVWF